MLVTGAAGFVAAALVEEAAGRGEAVVAVDRAEPLPSLAAAWAALPGDVCFELADVRDPDGVARVLERHRPSVVVHGAAVTSGPAREAADPTGILDVNIMGVARVLQAAHAAGVRRVVHLSSASAYGAAAFDGDALDEEATPSRPESLYSVTKFAGERTALRLGDLWGMDVRVARLTAVFGRWERDTGVRDTLSPQFQATALALRGEEAVLDRPGQRDWVYVRDVAEALLALRDAEAAPSVVNVGRGREWAVACWCGLLAERFPRFRWRLAERGETPTVDLHGARDRRPLAVDRLAALGYRSDWGLERSFQDYMGWVDAHPGMVNPPTSAR
ncbi:UDP-glucose 4-epimerase/UDP-glucuronate 4-epimerase [Stella humosa]|uniref:UDP-glucose 4-epimerase/UDP-glucuronate 4-epimerase n=1 Tax=Stella humosa TaxID=94 RepID=A0A3N1L277_9PROT|nr:NAD-dependent epimerase/dehydratase family protein [Stella humosa]ROP83625.1 UDP-glucose 4-epimerase/UDP-glucuronate 4-epimerase [Stella humosa]